MAVAEREINLEKLNCEFESKSAQDVVAWALEEFHPSVALACSFQIEDMAVLDMMLKANPEARIFTLDTGRLNPETYDVMDEVRDRYNVAIEVMFPQTEAVETMVRESGLNLFYESVENRKQCCGVRKVEPLNRQLGTLDAWITGLRREQAVTRTALPKVEIDDGHDDMIKINPIAEWTVEQTWAYVKENDLPYNALYDKGYPSIGCAPCTRQIEPGEDIRAGRWWWENPETKECGLHVKSS